MQDYFDVIKNIPLFNNIDHSELKALLNCLGAEIKTIPKGNIILPAGEKPINVGVVLSGIVHISKEDYDGNRVIITAAVPGEVFAESLCCAHIGKSPVTVFAGEDAAVMLLKFDRILSTCPNSCPFHRKLVENMLNLLANKNLHLQSRMEIIAAKSIRTKVLQYLETLGIRQGDSIAIPFNREELADYLCVERSALSHELSKMKRDGLIDYKKNIFVLK